MLPSEGRFKTQDDLPESPPVLYPLPEPEIQLALQEPLAPGGTLDGSEP